MGSTITTSTRRVPLEAWLAPALLGVAGLGWWWSFVMSRGMRSMTSMSGASMSLVAFLLAWIAMMAAMMLPAVLPVIRLYVRAASRRTVVPVPFFLAGYGVIWALTGVPAYFAWRGLEEPLAHSSPTAGRIAAGILLAAAIYQLSPLKTVCLEHCRSPLSFFMRNRRNLHRPQGAVAAGAAHGLYCVGCCWMLMAVLVAFGTMQLSWMAGLAALILIEKVTPAGERVAHFSGFAFLLLALILLLNPTVVGRLT